MSDPVQIHVVRRADLRSGPGPFDSDSTGFAVLNPRKRAAILDNPLLVDDQEPVQLIGTKGGIPIGRIDLISSRILVGGQPVSILWGSEWSVPEEHRPTMVGVMLLLKLQQLGYSLGAYGPSQMAIPVYQKLKWCDLPMNRWIQIRRSRPIVERYLGSGPHTSLLSGLANVGLAGFRGVLNARIASRCRGLEVRDADRFPERLDPQLAQTERPIVPFRSAAWINWLLTHSFENDPRTRRRLILLEKGGQSVGYAMLKVRFFPVATSRGFRNLLLGSVQDWLALDKSISDEQAMLLGMRELGRMGVDAIEVCSPSPSVDSLLKSLGLLRAGSFHLMYRPAPKTPLAAAEHTLAAWRARQVDGDNFLF